MGELQMNGDFIRYPDRLRQITDFSTFALRGSDADFETELTGDVVVRGEFKFRGTPLSRGQSILSQNWVKRSGQVSHAYFVVATHQVPVSEPITAADLTVERVAFRLPHMSRAVAVLYDDQYQPPLNLFLSELALRYGHYRFLTEHSLVNDLWFLDPVLCAAHDAPLARQNRDKNLAAIEASMNASSSLSWVLPPDRKTSEQHREEFLRWSPEAGTPKPINWSSVQTIGLPNHIVT